MAAIDLIVLGMLKKEPLSAYDIQKLVEYRNISKWVKISTPSIYKKVIQLEKKGFITGNTVREGKMPEKAKAFETSSPMTRAAAPFFSREVRRGRKARRKKAEIPE